MYYISDLNRYNVYYIKCVTPIYHPDILDRPRPELNSHFVRKINIGLVTTRQTREPFAALAVDRVCGQHKIVAKYGGSSILPLYLYPTKNTAKQKNLLDTSPWPSDEANGGRVPNLNPDFVTAIAQKLNLTFTPHSPGDLAATFGPEDIFHYIYAVFHSPIYHERYAEFLKIDFPRVPLTADVNLFRTLCGLGQQLVALHLLESPAVSQFITRYPITGDHRIEKGYPKYAPPGSKDKETTQAHLEGRIYINKTQYIAGIPPEVWEFHIGGYQVCAKWLKDRRGRQLSYDDLTHYQQVVVALKETMRLMAEVDQAIPDWPLE